MDCFYRWPQCDYHHFNFSLLFCAFCNLRKTLFFFSKSKKWWRNCSKNHKFALKVFGCWFFWLGFQFSNRINIFVVCKNCFGDSNRFYIFYISFVFNYGRDFYLCNFLLGFGNCKSVGGFAKDFSSWRSYKSSWH